MDGCRSWQEQHTQVCGCDKVIFKAEQYGQLNQWYILLLDMTISAFFGAGGGGGG